MLVVAQNRVCRYVRIIATYMRRRNYGYPQIEYLPFNKQVRNFQCLPDGLSQLSSSFSPTASPSEFRRPREMAMATARVLEL